MQKAPEDQLLRLTSELKERHEPADQFESSADQKLLFFFFFPNAKVLHQNGLLEMEQGQEEGWVRLWGALDQTPSVIRTPTSTNKVEKKEHSEHRLSERYLI